MRKGVKEMGMNLFHTLNDWTEQQEKEGNPPFIHVVGCNECEENPCICGEAYRKAVEESYTNKY